MRSQGSGFQRLSRDGIVTFIWGSYVAFRFSLLVPHTCLSIQRDTDKERGEQREREREKRKRQKEREREGQGEIERKREREWWRWGKRQRDERIELLVLLQTWPCEFAF